MQSNFQPLNTWRYNDPRPIEAMGDCHCCTETVVRSSLTELQGADVCHDCITQLFRSAIEFEINYPIKWGATALNIDDYAHIIPAAEVQLFKAKEREYATPPGDRIYCAPQGRPACGLFLGARMPATGARPSTKCHGCGRHSCLACGEDLGRKLKSPLNPASIHTCKKIASASETDAFKGLKRGKDYQVCPNLRCKRKVELQDGCNHIYCMCGASFCFICGENAEQNGGHWKEVARGGKGCPRYNQPGAGNAIFDGGHHHPVMGLGMIGMPGGAAGNAVMMRDFAQAVGGDLFAARQAFMQMPPAPQQNINNFGNFGRRNAVAGGHHMVFPGDDEDEEDDAEVALAALRAQADRIHQERFAAEAHTARIAQLARTQQRQLEWQRGQAGEPRIGLTPNGQAFQMPPVADTRHGFQARPRQSAVTSGQSFADRVAPTRNNFFPDTSGNTFGSTTAQPLPQARPQRQTPASPNRPFAAAAYPQTTAAAPQGSHFVASPRRVTPAPVTNSQQSFMGPTESSSRRSRTSRRGEGSQNNPFDFTRE